MSFPDYQPLDNPVWHALQTAHAHLAIGEEKVKRYPTDYLRFLGFEDPFSANLKLLEQYMEPGERIFMIGKPAVLPTNWQTHKVISCIQMVCEDITLPPLLQPQTIQKLGETDREDMLWLVNEVQPGYFFSQTPLLGDYYGIRVEGKLVAMAGERLRMVGFTEISAVVTHPDFTGRGFAQHLISVLSQKNLEDKQIPFLHFVNTNTRARGVYELLGFKERTLIPFAKISPV